MKYTKFYIIACVALAICGCAAVKSPEAVVSEPYSDIWDYQESKEYEEWIEAEDTREKAWGWVFDEPGLHVVSFEEVPPIRQKQYHLLSRKMPADSVIFCEWSGPTESFIMFHKNYIKVFVCNGLFDITGEHGLLGNDGVGEDHPIFLAYCSLVLPVNLKGIFQRLGDIYITYDSGATVAIFSTGWPNIKQEPICNMSDTEIKGFLEKSEICLKDKSLRFPFLRLYGTAKTLPELKSGRRHFIWTQRHVSVLAYNLTERDYKVFRTFVEKTFSTHVYFPKPLDHIYYPGAIGTFDWLKKPRLH